MMDLFETRQSADPAPQQALPRKALPGYQTTTPATFLQVGPGLVPKEPRLNKKHLGFAYSFPTPIGPFLNPTQRTIPNPTYLFSRFARHRNLQGMRLAQGRLVREIQNPQRQIAEQYPESLEHRREVISQPSQQAQRNHTTNNNR